MKGLDLDYSSLKRSLDKQSMNSNGYILLLEQSNLRLQSFAGLVTSNPHKNTHLFQNDEIDVHPSQ